jgi:hypothetical protein
MDELVRELKVSTEIKLRSVGVLLDLPGRENGFVEIDDKDPKHCETVLKMMANRGWKDLLVVIYTETGKMVRF